MTTKAVEVATLPNGVLYTSWLRHGNTLLEQLAL